MPSNDLRKKTSTLLNSNGFQNSLVKSQIQLLQLFIWSLYHILCLSFWYGNMSSEVKWSSQKSRSFPVPLGIKQGGINSPDFFACYFNGLTQLLRQLKLGCHIGNLFLASLFFADDIVLLAPTRSALQRMINSCHSYCNQYGLAFNAKKSKVMVFSRAAFDKEAIKPLNINGIPIDCVDQIKYLGTTITSNPSLSFSHEEDLRSFYRASNSVLNQISSANEPILMQLLYSHCVPCFSYAAAMKDYTSRQMNECTVAVNDAIRKIFTFIRWESVRTLREDLGYPALSDIFARARSKFQASLPRHHNPTISRLSYLTQVDT